MKDERIHILDMIRGFAILVMVGYHAIFDLVTFFDVPTWVCYNDVFDTLLPIFICFFVLISGICSNFSQSNTKRGLKVLLLAILMSVVTHLIKTPIVFGVLHMLGCCMVLYGLLQKQLDRIPRPVALGIYGLFTVLTWPLWLGVYTDVNIPGLFIFGFVTAGFQSYDYFPLFPWLFLFLFGTVLGKYVKEGKFPRWFYEVRISWLETVGRHTLWIYLLHQPILYGILYGIHCLIA